MSNAANIALTGLNDAAQRVANAASNIVNASSLLPPSSPLPKIAGNNSGAATQDTITVSGAAGSNDLATNLININNAKISYGADAAVIKTADKMQKSLLDIVS